MEKQSILLISFFLFAFLANAQKPIELKLWQEGAPNSNELYGEEFERSTNRIANVVDPTIAVYVAKNGNGKAIVACPGGGYAQLAMDHEGHDLAQWFNAQGITYAVLKYRMPNGHNEVPLSDAQQAIRIMRAHADEWGIKQVGIMGSSAGGHLASTAATHYTADCRPDFQILFYPVISMDLNICHRGSRDNLLGKTPTDEEVQLFSNELQVTADTPPAFIMHSSDDRTVPVENSIRYYQALVKNKVPASMHLYPIGGHGWGFRDSFIYKRQWSEEMEKWLREL